MFMARSPLDAGLLPPLLCSSETTVIDLTLLATIVESLIKRFQTKYICPEA
jgi:hypothetical protein